MESTLSTPEALREVYRRPGRGARDKQIDRIDDHCRQFIAHSPLLMIGTADGAGACDVSPRGGPPGFVAVLGDGSLAIPDLQGNNRLDSMENLVANPGVGLLFLIPGMDETLRVNGTATVSTDPDVVAAAAIDATVPRAAIVVDVTEAYIHCAKAFRRGGVWHPEQWPDTTDMASVACMIRDHTGLADVPVATIEAALEDSYEQTMWRPGGSDNLS